MKCPYCGAEVYGRYCEYCDSEVNPNMVGSVPAAGRKVAGPDGIKPEFVTVEEMCHKFLMRKDVSEDPYASMMISSKGSRVRFGHRIHSRLTGVLGIPSGDTIYLIHDDTMLHTGKNGFAITSSGFYSKSMDTPLVHVDWDQFAMAELVRENVNIRAGAKEITYVTDAASIKDALWELVNHIHQLIGVYGDSIL